MSAGIHKIYREDDQPFTMVPNEAIRDPEIAPNAFRLLVYLMSHQDGYSVTYEQIERQTTLKRYAINGAIKILTAKGYLEVQRSKQPNGQWGTKDWILKHPSTVGHSTVEPSHLGPFHSGTTSGLKENQPIKKNTLVKKNTQETVSEFDQFWAVYPKKADKRAAERAFTNALKRASVDIILEGAQRYAKDPNRVDRFTKNPATWLNADSWENPPEPSRNGPRRLSNAEQAALMAVEREKRDREIVDAPEVFQIDPAAVSFEWMGKEVD